MYIYIYVCVLFVRWCLTRILCDSHVYVRQGTALLCKPLSYIPIQTSYVHDIWLGYMHVYACICMYRSVGVHMSIQPQSLPELYTLRDLLTSDLGLSRAMQTYIRTDIHTDIHTYTQSTYMHTHTNKYAQTCQHTNNHRYILTYLHASAHTYIHTDIHTYIQTCIHIKAWTKLAWYNMTTWYHIISKHSMQTREQKHAHKHMRIHKHTCTHAYMRTHTYIHTYIHMYIHNCMASSIFSFAWGQPTPDLKRRAHSVG